MRSTSASPARRCPDDSCSSSGRASGTRLDEHVKATIIESISESLGVDIGRIDMDEPFADYGLDSITAVNLVQVLNRAFRLDRAAHPWKPQTLFDHSSVNQLAAHVVSQYGSASLPLADRRCHVYAGSQYLRPRSP